MKKLIVFLIGALVIFGVAVSVAAVTKADLLSALDTALADGIVSSDEKTNLLTLLDSYLAGPAPTEGADLIIDSITTDPVSPVPGKEITIVAIMKNQGTESATTAGASEIEVYVDETLVHVASSTLDLSPGETHTTGAISKDTQGNKFLWALPGTHKIKVIADANNLIDETREDNNDRVKTLVMGPDIIVQDILLDPSVPKVNENFTVTAVIKNRGNQQAKGAAMLQLTIAGEIEGNKWRDLSLDPGKSQKITFAEVLSYPTAGTYEVKVEFDRTEVMTEANEDNNIAEKTIAVVLQ